MSENFTMIQEDTEHVEKLVKALTMNVPKRLLVSENSGIVMGILVDLIKETCNLYLRYLSKENSEDLYGINLCGSLTMTLNYYNDPESVQSQIDTTFDITDR